MTGVRKEEIGACASASSKATRRAVNLAVANPVTQAMASTVVFPSSLAASALPLSFTDFHKTSNVR